MEKIIIDGVTFVREPALDEPVIVRCEHSGVFYGQIARREGREVTLKNVRQVWFWARAATLLQLAQEGDKKPEQCKFSMIADEILVLDAIEILKTSPEARKNIEAVPEWKA